MDSSFTIKSPLPGVQKPRDPVAVRAAVETDLDVSKTAGATGDGGSKSDQRASDRRGEHPSHDHPPAGVEVDPESRDLIYRERDVRTADREHPDQALLRQRAYRQAPHDGEMPLTGDPHADIKA
jgi:hypothetical protein